MLSLAPQLDVAQMIGLLVAFCVPTRRGVWIWIQELSGLMIIGRIATQSRLASSSESI
jgi:hypothetical protein